MTRIWNKFTPLDKKLSNGAGKQLNPHTKNLGVGAGTPLKRKVFVGLSGGVDSSVSAALLKEAGYNVTGVFLRVWSLDFARDEQPFRLECTTKDDRLDAMRVAAKLGIPFMELDLEKEYKKEVVDYMIREYKAGKTPNPDVFCNRFIKFGGFYKWAMKKGADFIATGHYAQVSRILSNGRISNQTRMEPVSFPRKRESRLDYRLRGNDNLFLCAGLDRNKDQSYFLWQLRKEQLPHILFPVGGMKKSEVRKLAKKFGLVTAGKKDSQGLCFVGKVDMKEFLSHYIKPKRGDILLAADERRFGRGLTQMRETVIGEHDGAFFYTIGERMRFEAENTYDRMYFLKGRETPLYVIRKNMRRNTLTVSPKSPEGSLGGAVREVALKDCNWLVTPQKGKTYQARVRYRQPLQRAQIYADMSADTRGLNRRTSASPSAAICVRFESAQNVAPGQSLVLYDGDTLIGGGVME